MREHPKKAGLKTRLDEVEPVVLTRFIAVNTPTTRELARPVVIDPKHADAPGSAWMNESCRTKESKKRTPFHGWMILKILWGTRMSFSTIGYNAGFWPIRESQEKRPVTAFPCHHRSC